MGLFLIYILPMFLVGLEIIFMRTCLTPKIPRIICLIAFVAALVPILGATVSIALPIIICNLLDGNDVELVDNRFNRFWF